MIFSNTDFSYQTGRFLRFGNKKVKKEVYPYENDISAEKKAQKESPWVQEPDEHKRWKKSIGSQKSKGKKEIIRIGHSIVTFFLFCICQS